MDELLRKKCAQLADNRDEIRKGFLWEHELMRIAAAMIFTDADRYVDVARMKECRQILRKNKGVFSAFRGNLTLAVISKMALSETPQDYLEKLFEVYDELRRGRVFGSEYLAAAAISICDRRQGEHEQDAVKRTLNLMKRIKQIHPFLTSSEDMAFITLLALTDKDEEQILSESESCYTTMKEYFSMHSNAVQSLSHVMAAIEGSAEEKCKRVRAIYNEMRTRKIRYGKHYELAALGTLAGIEKDPDQVVDEIFGASEYLKERKGFKNWTIGGKTRLMFAVLMAAGQYSGNNIAMNTSVISSSLSMVIAEQLLLIMVTNMAATSAHTSSH